ncbi:MAG: cohesin domain-containing protein [Candidatus Dojkabacteria bacterium]|nr:cohesin domain-containing protein [Candidatus Dojkabacteria bacterium]MDD4561139.1 cohesin domain-containing protein [Candidatus Dojkabacteria bacterium]
MKISKKILTILFSLSFLFLGSTFLFASEPSMSFYPNGGVVLNKNNGFIVDILIDSSGEEIALAKFTVLFDPQFLQLKKAERNNTLFDQFPVDELSTDNENGVILLTGFTQSGTSTLYKTGEKPDVFARLTFDVLQEGETELGWEYVGTGVTFDTVMLKDGSPPTNILTAKPESATFTVGDVLIDPNIPTTSVPIDKYLLITGIILVIFGGVLVLTKPKRPGRRKGTVLLYGDE